MSAMSTAAGSGSMAEGLAMVEAGLAILAGLDKAGMPGEALGGLLLALERHDAVGAAVRGAAMAAFDAQGGPGDGQRTTRVSWRAGAGSAAFAQEPFVASDGQRAADHRCRQVGPPASEPPGKNHGPDGPGRVHARAADRPADGDGGGQRSSDGQGRHPARDPAVGGDRGHHQNQHEGDNQLGGEDTA